MDYFTGFEISFAVFYLIPVATTAWFVRSKNAALIVSVTSAATWQFSNFLAGEHFSHLLVPAWNASTRLAFFLVVSALIFKLKKALADQSALARTDYLTGAANPRAFYEQAQTEIARCLRYNHPLTLAYLDADNFKKINDTLGHHVGSDLLVKVVALLKENLRATDVIARLGGDEFAIMLPETDSVQARAAIEKLRRKLQEKMKSEGWAVTFSIGVMTYLKPPEKVDEVIKFADEVMYEVKKSGKNSVKFKQHSSSPKPARKNLIVQPELELTHS